MKIAACVAILVAISGAALAGGPTRASADAAIAAANSVIAQAAALHDQWTPTMTAFRTAKAAEQKGDYATAEAQAKRARRFAELSIRQAIAQKTLWRNEVVR